MEKTLNPTCMHCTFVCWGPETVHMMGRREGKKARIATVDVLCSVVPKMHAQQSTVIRLSVLTYKATKHCYAAMHVTIHAPIDA